MQSAPGVHDMHRPPTHVRFAPHDVPLDTSPVSVHVACPALQEVVPVSHGLPFGWHEAPATHEPHVPFKQTSFVPQAVPSGTLVIWTHAGDPDAQDVMPDWQTFPGALQTTP